MIPNPPRYTSPKERAENRARLSRFVYRAAVAIPVTVALVMFGYSDQAPRWLREFTVALDASLGFPILWLIKTLMA